MNEKELRQKVVIVSAGVFTVLISVGLIPRFAGKMHVARKIFVLEMSHGSSSSSISYP